MVLEMEVAMEVVKAMVEEMEEEEAPEMEGLAQEVLEAQLEE